MSSGQRVATFSFPYPAAHPPWRPADRTAYGEAKVAPLLRCDVPDCEGHLELLLLVVHVQEHLAQQLREINAKLSHIGQAILYERNQMSQVDDRLAQVQSTLSTVAASLANDTAEVTRALGDLRNALSGNLTPEQSSAFDAVDQAVAGLQSTADGIASAVETADPSPAPAPQQ